MRRILFILSVIAVTGVSTSAFAMEPPAPAQPTSTGAPAPAAVEAPKETSAPASSASTVNAATTTSASGVNDKGEQVKVTAGDDEAAAQMKRFKAAGYKPEVHNGVVVFCRNETQMGSRFERKVCQTAHLLELQMKEAQSELESYRRKVTVNPWSN